MQNKVMLTFFATTLFFLQTPQPAAQVKVDPKEVHAATEEMGASRSVMIIDPKARADEYKKAFDILREEKSTSKVFFKLAGGMQISNVLDMKLMPNSTLVIFRYSTPQGIRFQVVETEDILGIMHQ